MAARKPPPPPSPPPPASAPLPPPALPAWDGVFHRLFAHASMVSNLLGNFLPPELGATLDLARFAREAPLPLNAVQHSDKGHARTGDLLQPLYTVPQTGSRGALLLLEFQAAPDTTMPLRMMVYGGLALQRVLALTRDRPKALAASLAVLRATPTSLPPVLPVVLYHGKEPWGRRRSVRDTTRLSPGLPPGLPPARWPLRPDRRLAGRAPDVGPRPVRAALRPHPQPRHARPAPRRRGA